MKIYKITLIAAASALGSISASAASLDFTGTTLSPLSYSAEASTGLEAIYVLDSTAGVSLHYSNTQGNASKVYRFSNLGGAYAEEIASTTSADGTISAKISAGDMGYIVEIANRRYCFWVVDYSQHRLSFNSLAVAPTQEDCGRTALVFDGDASEIPYYTINGRRMELSRDIEASYMTLAFDEDNFVYSTDIAHETFSHLTTTFSVPAPLCDSSISLTGDRFLKAWNEEVQLISPEIKVTAVEAETRATQTERDADNEQKDESADGQLGGSAPCEITFEAAVTDGAIFREWQISRTPDFDIVDNSFNELEFTYTFRENGTTYVRFVAADADGKCQFTGTVYNIGIGESRLEIPNAFSPGSSPGVNDEWKVSYRSLISFECHIFNRWGTQMASFTDPSQGWDGKYGGKLVPPGVYYYVIKARGADGTDYKRSGDINIINFNSGSTSSENSPAGN